jgi:hypothetical protein
MGRVGWRDGKLGGWESVENWFVERVKKRGMRCGLWVVVVTIFHEWHLLFEFEDVVSGVAGVPGLSNNWKLAWKRLEKHGIDIKAGEG